MGKDGRFYASMVKEQLAELNNSFPGPAANQDPHKNSMSKLASSGSKKIIKSLLSSHESLDMSERRKQ